MPQRPLANLSSTLRSHMITMAAVKDKDVENFLSCIRMSCVWEVSSSNPVSESSPIVKWEDSTASTTILLLSIQGWLYDIFRHRLSPTCRNTLDPSCPKMHTNSQVDLCYLIPVINNISASQLAVSIQTHLSDCHWNQTHRSVASCHAHIVCFPVHDWLFQLFGTEMYSVSLCTCFLGVLYVHEWITSH